MPHHLTSFVAALTGSISSGTCCGCIPFTFSPAVTPTIASTTAPLSAAIPNTVLPAAVASQSAVSSTPVLTSVMSFFAPLLSFYKNYQNYQDFEETKVNNKEKVDKSCQCNLINSDELDFNYNKKEPSYVNENKSLEDNHISNDNHTSDNECYIKDEILLEELRLLAHEKCSSSSEFSGTSFLDDKELEHFKNINTH
ncbi:hypothetical protein CYL21_1972 [Plasmodium falciparum NF54]|uniref:Uncharacterized protein n=2 Tax=Plasmodium falciparum TaxID=5833 RepID=Q8IEQ8_PLAF7|nr:conserved Plasmodium protein, unknown function [Plasmodium falciparum 3D7]EWC86944.1 hypothetical protein PFNF54_04124 [Plasmodium falciparum NF54]KAF4329832.1 hypothetical protein CYL21_1972 [Plasmodium falciparum NF54]PKC47268.1 hypothetical protein CK202_2910 [Plasmodium falciparum NF54]CAD52191.1 conserved Plasmodium protein, unknown function [Plasmodium falciparum 3D7]|eukprot:XP_001349784.1 conserved Plasmodium protein, unknown function [Plasmodium falciparum 3D7]